MKNIAIVFGGYSSEFDVSVNSSKQMQQAIDSTRYRAYRVLVSKEQWLAYLDDTTTAVIDKNDFSFADTQGHKVLIDCVLNGIHGTPGEDGKLGGYFDMLGIPYTSCGVLAAALTFNKYYCNNYLRPLGIKIAPSVLLYAGSDYDLAEVAQTVGFPCFVKPNNGGSSCGISKANTAEELSAAIAIALREDNQVIVEKYIKGRELTCGVLKTKTETLLFPPTEVISKKEFFDYEAKYTDSLADEITPAQVPEEVIKRCQQTSLQVYELLNCSGVVRVDYILSGDDLYFLEVNTVPGMSKNSIIPKQAAVLGLSLGDLFAKMIDDATER